MTQQKHFCIPQPQICHHKPRVSKTDMPKGFSLLELLIVCNLLGMMLLVAWPSFREMLDRQDAESYLRHFRQHLNFARISAVSTARPVTVCPLYGKQCVNQWWQIPIHLSHTDISQTNFIQIRQLPQLAESHWLYYNRAQLQYRADGSLNALQNGTFIYCVKQYPWHFTLTLSQAGRSQTQYIARPCPR